MHTDLKAYFTRQPEKGLLSLEACTLIYLVITTLMVLVCWDNLPQPRQMLVMRAQIIALMVLTNVVYYCYPSRITVALRALPLFALLVLWYPETYDFCRQFPYQDHIFANLDWTIFGCQPAMTFSQWLSSDFWYEAMHLGYYSYYYLMAAVIVFYFCCRYGDFQRASFVFFASFFLFYLIYDLLPVAGPQYYYNTPALSGDAWRFPIFPEVGSYFAEHTDALVLEPRGLFSRLVISAQEIGERPTAAFPSSHVGVCGGVHAAGVAGAQPLAVLAAHAVLPAARLLHRLHPRPLRRRCLCGPDCWRRLLLAHAEGLPAGQALVLAEGLTARRNFFHRENHANSLSQATAAAPSGQRGRGENAASAGR